MTDNEYQRRLNNHDAWFKTAQALFETAELIWSRVQPGFDELLAHRKRVANEVGFSEDQSPSDSLTASVPLVVLMPLQDYGNAYLLNAGFAVENLLKAIRVKRLQLQPGAKDVEFGHGDDQIPKRHIYDQMARVELRMSGTDPDIALLKRLATFVEWAGRYPIMLRLKPGDDLNLRVHQIDRENVQALHRRLMDAYYAIGR